MIGDFVRNAAQRRQSSLKTLSSPVLRAERCSSLLWIDLMSQPTVSTYLRTLLLSFLLFDMAMWINVCCACYNWQPIVCILTHVYMLSCGHAGAHDTGTNDNQRKRTLSCKRCSETSTTSTYTRCGKHKVTLFHPDRKNTPSLQVGSKQTQAAKYST